MKDQLISYIDLLFAGAAGADDVKQEILQNTLDRYDDLIAQGKAPQAAYSLAISGIGDISEILRDNGQTSNCDANTATELNQPPAEDADSDKQKLLRAVSTALYILCPVPLFVLSEIGMDTLGLCGLLTFVAVATALRVMCKKKAPGHSEKSTASQVTLTPQQELRKSIQSMIRAIGLVVYFIISFATGAWYITWLVFLIIPAVQGLVTACMDLKEVSGHEA